MLSKEVIQMETKYSSEILDVIYNQEQFTTSDLQGVAGAIIESPVTCLDKSLDTFLI